MLHGGVGISESLAPHGSSTVDQAFQPAPLERSGPCVKSGAADGVSDTFLNNEEPPGCRFGVICGSEHCLPSFESSFPRQGLGNARRDRGGVINTHRGDPAGKFVSKINLEFRRHQVYSDSMVYFESRWMAVATQRRYGATHSGRKEWMNQRANAKILAAFVPASFIIPKSDIDIVIRIQGIEVVAAGL